MNIQTLAARLALNEKKLKKADAPGVLERLYNQTSCESTRVQLARLYTTLMPKPAPKKNKLAWVAQACSKDDTQPSMRHIFVRDGYAMGCDGFRIHFYQLGAEQAEALEVEGKFIDCDFNVLDLPGVEPLAANALKQFSPNIEEMPYRQQVDLSACEVVPLEDTRDTAYEMDLFDTVSYFNKRFVDQIAPGEACLTVYAKDAGNDKPVWFNAGENKTVLLMPIRRRREEV
jgi:hypothetical protein